MTIKQNSDKTAYLIHSGGSVVGLVKRHDAWTVRGTRKTWDAYRNGRIIQGGFGTRYDAAAFLASR